jgi:hypothetical protein
MTTIQDKFSFLFQNVIDLGQPVGGEESTYDGGTKQRYDAGVIYFHPRVGTPFECHGLILQAYLEEGEELSGLGYPITDESDNLDVAGGRMNTFENGAIFFDPAAGTSVQFANDQVLIPQVVVKVEESIPINLGQGETLSLDQLAGLAGPLGGTPILQTINGLLPGMTFSRLFDSLDPASIQDLINTAQADDPDYNPPSFGNWLEIDFEAGFDPGALVDALNQWAGVVELAYIMPEFSDPSVVGTLNTFFGQQNYLKGNQIGINVQAAWAQGADGDGTRFIDLELGWFLGHEDLPAGIQLLDGINRLTSFTHGTAVLGEIVGVDNDKGIVGIAPQSNVRLISYNQKGPDPTQKQINARVADMILNSTRALSFGDVLLLEVQVGGQVGAQQDVVIPVETDPAVFEAIRLATKVGVIVVEAAGNGGAFLDNFTNKKGQHVLARGNPAEFTDSGAIMVGASFSALPHNRIDSVNTPANKGIKTNFGTRIDCYGWGENILTSGSLTNPKQPDGYLNGQLNGQKFFGGTSGASPMIVGVCLLVQNLQSLMTPKSGIQGRLGPFSMRQMLSNTANGTVAPASDMIGVMPDMALIIANEYTV